MTGEKQQQGGSGFFQRFRLNPDLQIGVVIGLGLLLVMIKLFLLP